MLPAQTQLDRIIPERCALKPMEKFRMYAASLALVLPLIVEAHPPTQSPAELAARACCARLGADKTRNRRT